MSGLYQFINRFWTTVKPSRPPKKDTALRVGLLGASKIAPLALINPALSHPEVIIVAVAARDHARAQAYAKKYNIPIIHKSYQELLDDPTIDAVYVPLPNGLHYEWALKALKAGKHVLLEKPSTSNAADARKLFTHPLLSQPNAPVLLEAFHYRFHPAWQTFLRTLDPANITSAMSKQWLPKGIIPPSDIRFIYDLAGGALMDFGAYNVSALRGVFGSGPVSCDSASYRPMPPGLDPQCDHAVTASWTFPNGGKGSITADLAATGNWPLPWATSTWPRFSLPYTHVEHAEVERVDADAAAAGERHSVQRTVRMWNPLGPSVYHRIDITDTHTTRRRSDEQIVATWTERQYVQAYRPPAGELGDVGEEWWTTYRHQLEQFVNRIKGREGSGVWVGAQDSIEQMEMIDGVYEKMGLPLRPGSTYTG